jgi:Protein of unknown function (DUF3306)
MTDNPDDGFLTRWARRKAQVKVDEQPASPPATLATPEPDKEPTQDEIDAYVATLPRLDDFTALTDLRPFLNRLVPQVLQLAAMRRVWALDPMVRDFVNDAREYAYDWNVPGGAPGYGPLETTDEMRDWVMKTLSRAAPETGLSNDPDQARADDKTSHPVAALTDDPPDQHGAVQPLPAATADEAGSPELDTGIPAGIGVAPSDNREPLVIAAVHNEPAPARVRHGGALPR